MEGNDRTDVLREKVFLSTNMNGWEVEEERQQSGGQADEIGGAEDGGEEEQGGRHRGTGTPLPEP